MYQTLKSSFKNYEEKINQMKELLGSNTIAESSKEELIEMMNMILMGEDGNPDSLALETDRPKR